jgi:hypothetical protein
MRAQAPKVSNHHETTIRARRKLVPLHESKHREEITMNSQPQQSPQHVPQQAPQMPQETISAKPQKEIINIHGLEFEIEHDVVDSLKARGGEARMILDGAIPKMGVKSAIFIPKKYGQPAYIGTIAKEWAATNNLDQTFIAKKIKDLSNNEWTGTRLIRTR